MSPRDLFARLRQAETQPPSARKHRTFERATGPAKAGHYVTGPAEAGRCVVSLFRHFLHLASVWALMRVLKNYDRRADGVARATVSSRTVTRTTRMMLAPWLSATLCVVPSVVDAADLQSRTAQAYEKYADAATREFVARAQKMSPDNRCDGVMTARAGSGDGILDVPDGLIHHWVGRAFVKGATIKQVVNVARDYTAYSKVYKNVVSTKVLSQQGDSYRVLIRLKEGELGVDAVLDVRSAVDYRTLSDGSISAMSKSEEIRQVENAGRANESLLPAGRDSGYLWRAHTYTLFVPQRDGVFVVMETLGLSRRFPPFTGWIIEPIARRLGRKSVEGSLDEFATAIRASAGLPAPRSSC